MSKKLPDYLLDKYLKGQCTPDEEAAVEGWYNSFENDVNYLSFASAEERDEIKNRIRNKVENDINPITDINSGRRKTFLYIAYSLSGVAAAILLYFSFIRPAKYQADANKLVIVSNTTKNISEQILSDGSRVWMMPGAEIKYPKIFTGNKREITLSGESFFEITKNHAKPFIVYSGNLITKVWGTSFRIRDSKNLSYADVTVLTGKVSVKILHPDALHNHAGIPAMSEVMIYPNQQVSYTKKEHLFKEQPKAEMQDLTIWKKEDLSFDNKSIKDVIPVLNEAFNVNISTADPKIDSYLLSADLSGSNFPQIMEMMHKALNVNYEISGKNVIIKQNQ